MTRDSGFEILVHLAKREEEGMMETGEGVSENLTNEVTEEIQYLIREWMKYCGDKKHDLDVLVYGIDRITKKPKACLAFGFARIVQWRLATREPSQETPRETPRETVTNS